MPLADMSLVFKNTVVDQVGIHVCEHKPGYQHDQLSKAEHIQVTCLIVWQ